MQLFRAVFLAQGRGRRPTLPDLHMKIPKATLLQLAVLRQEAGRSWDDASSWVTSLCPNYPAGSVRHLIQSTVNEAEKRSDDFSVFLTEICDLDCIGKLN